MNIEITDEKLHPTLEMMKPIVIVIAETFGKNCEVVMHDLKNPRSSVVMVANGHVTGRKVGQSFRDLIQSVLRSQHFKNDLLSNYSTKTKEGKKLKSSTALIREGKEEVVGALCINYDIDNFVTSLKTLEEFCKTIEDETENNREEDDVLNGDVNNILRRIIDGVIEENPVTVPQMKKEHKKEIVHFLDDKGVFLIKGAVDHLAKEINVSRYTIYNYLDEVRSGFNGNQNSKR